MRDRSDEGKLRAQITQLAEYNESLVKRGEMYFDLQFSGELGKKIWRSSIVAKLGTKVCISLGLYRAFNDDSCNISSAISTARGFLEKAFRADS